MIWVTAHRWQISYKDLAVYAGTLSGFNISQGPKIMRTVLLIRQQQKWAMGECPQYEHTLTSQSLGGHGVRGQRHKVNLHMKGIHSLTIKWACSSATKPASQCWSNLMEAYMWFEIHVSFRLLVPRERDHAKRDSCLCISLSQRPCKIRMWPNRAKINQIFPYLQFLLN